MVLDFVSRHCESSFCAGLTPTDSYPGIALAPAPWTLGPECTLSCPVQARPKLGGIQRFEIAMGIDTIGKATNRLRWSPSDGWRIKGTTQGHGRAIP
jgi:hypothetical protein